jgi:hypothetical protein
LDSKATNRRRRIQSIYAAMLIINDDASRFIEESISKEVPATPVKQ